MDPAYLPRHVLLVDRDPAMVSAWEAAFAAVDAVEAIRGDYFARRADAMVSPANAFGIRDGGLDLAIRAELGVEVQAAVQARIEERHHGELPVGQAEVVPTGDVRWPYLVVAPTMRVPTDVSQTLHAYLAFRAALLAIAQHGATGAPIRSLICCGLGTGVGAMEPERCAHQMAAAWRQLHGPARIPGGRAVLRAHAALNEA